MIKVTTIRVWVAIIFLFSAGVYISQALDVSHMEKAARLGADWLVRNQHPVGDFLYEFDLHEGRETESNSIVRQAGGLYALGLVYRRFPEEKYLSAAQKAIDYFVSVSRTYNQNGKTVRYIIYDDRSPNNATALALLGLTELMMTDDHLKQQYLPLAEEFGRHLLASQQDNGRFYYRYEHAEQHFAGENDYNNGETLFALVRMTALSTDPQYKAAVQRATPALTQKYQENFSVSAYAWLVEGLTDWYFLTKDDSLVETILAQTDTILQRGEFRTLEYMTTRGGPPPVASALGVFTEGIAHAQRVAQAVGDRQRSQQYQKIMQQVARFLRSKQIRHPNRLSDDLLAKVHGAFCTTNSCETIRVDIVQHNVAAIIYTWGNLKSLREAEPNFHRWL